MRIIIWTFTVLLASAAMAHANPVAGTVALLGTIGIAEGTATIIAGFIVSTVTSVLARAIFGGQQTQRQPGINTPIVLTGDVNPEKFILGTYATAGHLVYPPLTHNANHNKVMLICGPRPISRRRPRNEYRHTHFPVNPVRINIRPPPS